MKIWNYKKSNATSAFIIGLALVLTQATLAFAQQSSSSNYGVNELIFGSGGNPSLTSASYSALGTAGEAAVGNLTSAAFQAYGGFQTTNVPFLEAVVTPASIDLGVLDTSSTATATSTFYVRSYLASGYVVTTLGLPTTSSNDTIAPMTSAGASTIGTEQFGINLVANTVPSSFGANPVQVPDASFSFGQAASDYDTANQYKYNEGDIIAESNSSSGRTDYTVSYIYNIGGVTEAGNYILNHVVIVTSTF